MLPAAASHNTPAQAGLRKDVRETEGRGTSGGRTDVALADALDQELALLHELARLEHRRKDGAVRVGQHDGHVGLDLLQPAPDAREGAAGRAPRDEVRDRVLRLLQQLRRERLLVGLRIGEVVVLPQTP